MARFRHGFRTGRVLLKFLTSMPIIGENDEMGRISERMGARRLMSTPRLSFGVPVYNGEDTLARCLESLLAQDFEDFEVVVVDNASTDGSRQVIEAFAAKDERIRAVFNDENIGQIQNCNKVYELSTGTYFRWVGVSDWIEPSYARKCVEALDADPEAVAVTTYFRIHFDDGTEVCAEYDGERMESPDPARRFARMLWFFHAGEALYDPLYGVLRRSALEKTDMLVMITKADFMLAAELSLLGRFAQIPEILAHREKPADLKPDTLEMRKRYHPKLYKQLYTTPWKHLRILQKVIKRCGMAGATARRCKRAAWKFAWIETKRKTEARVNDFRRNRLGLTKANLARLVGRGPQDDESAAPDNPPDAGDSARRLEHGSRRAPTARRTAAAPERRA